MNIYISEILSVFCSIGPNKLKCLWNLKFILKVQAVGFWHPMNKTSSNILLNSKYFLL